MGEEPPLETEVAAAAPALGESASAYTSEFAHFSDHELQAKIQRVLLHLSSDIAFRLADGGAKLKAHLTQMRAEVDRRKLVRVGKDAGACNRMTRSKDRNSPAIVKDCMQSGAVKDSREFSFASRFLEKLEGQAGATCNEALNEASEGKNKGCRHNEVQEHERKNQIATSSQSSRFSSRQTPFQSVSSISMKAHRSSMNDERSPSESGIKRRRTADSDGKKSLAWKFKKVREVVLLDDEEVHSGESTGDGSDKWKEMKIYYPSRDDPESVELSYTDIKCLDPESYLSSPIMNFYIQYLQVDRRREDYHFFNTYFYKKLEEAVSPRADKSCFKKLRRWWKGINIFQKSYIFIPVHGDMHWSLVIICIPTKGDESGPIVLHLDSLGLHNSYLIFDVIDRYLKQEWSFIKDQNSTCPDILISEKLRKHLSQRIDKKSITVPQQKNVYDCGLFVLYFIERFIEEAPERLRKKDLAMLGDKWFRAEDASGLRERIKDLLLEVFRHAKVEGAEAESTSSDSASEDVDNNV